VAAAAAPAAPGTFRNHETSSETKLLLGLALFVVLGGGALAFLNYLGRPRPPREPVQAETRQKWDALARGARHAKGDRTRR
jgi:hypothetical protein